MFKTTVTAANAVTTSTNVVALEIPSLTVSNDASNLSTLRLVEDTDEATDLMSDERDEDDPSILEPRLDSRLEIDDSRAAVVAGAELTSIFVKPTPVIVRPSGDSYLASI